MNFETEIKTALKAAGLSEDLWTKITVKTVDEIAGAVTQLKADSDKTKSYTKEELINILRDAGLENAFNKALESETDRRMTVYLKNQDEKLKKAADETVNKKKVEAEKATLTPEQTEFQSLKDTVKALNEKLDGLTTTITASDMSSRVRAELKKQGLSEKFEANITVADPEKIAEVVAGFKTTYDEAQQANIDAKLAAGELSPVKRGAAGQTLEQSNIAAYAASKGVGGAVKNPDFPGKISSPETGKTETAKE